MEDNNFTTEYKKVTVKFMDGNFLYGRINILPYERISDFINNKDKAFVIMVESGSPDHAYETVFINKKKVVWVQPED